jgi:hypothetical protein
MLEPVVLTRCRRGLPFTLGVLTMAVSGCNPALQVPPAGLSLVRPRPQPAALEPNPRPPAAAGLGLQPLPSPDQVTAAVALGRIDPFLDPRPPEPVVAAPAVAGAAAAAGAPSGSGVPGATSPSGGSPTPGSPSASRGVASAGGAGSAAAPVRSQPSVPRLPLLLTGVIQTGPRPSAIVQSGSNSGSLLAGEKGSHANPFLPPGWRVESININAGKMVLRHGSQREPYFLTEI